MNLKQSDQFRLTHKADMKNNFGFTKQILIIIWHYNNIIMPIGIRLNANKMSGI